jgi:hypothetical protein
VGIRVSQYLSRVKQWEAINFGEYGQYPCAVVMKLVCIMVFVALHWQTDYLLFQFGCIR